MAAASFRRNAIAGIHHRFYIVRHCHVHAVSGLPWRLASPTSPQGSEQGGQRGNLPLRLNLHQSYLTGEVVALGVEVAQVIVSTAAVAFF